MKQVRLKDIAEKTGYSINAVSHALNDRPDIAPKTKEFIIQTAREMGYIANASASALRSGKTKSIAIIVGDISNPHFSLMIKEMESRLRDFGYNAIIMNTEEDEQIERAAIVSAIGKKVDGIIICPAQKTRDNFNYLKEVGIPFILFGRRFEGGSSHYCICDDMNGGFVAAEYLLQLNHRKILFINGPICISSARDRLDGIKRAFLTYEQNLDDLHIVNVPSMGSDTVIPDILENNSDCTGIICFSDLIAMQVCHFLKKQGRQVPDDVSVIGFDNIASKFYFPLMITSVTSSKTKMSVQTVETLMKVIETADHETDPAFSQSILPTTIVARESAKPL